MNFAIDPEFRKLIPPLTTEERALLERNLVEEGCREPLVIWKEKSILLDGHNRAEICEAKGIKYQTIEISLLDRTSAKIWILRNQLGRTGRNRITHDFFTKEAPPRRKGRKSEDPDDEGPGVVAEFA